jgi:hypothetical protein
LLKVQPHGKAEASIVGPAMTQLDECEQVEAFLFSERKGKSSEVTQKIPRSNQTTGRNVHAILASKLNETRERIRCNVEEMWILASSW